MNKLENIAKFNVAIAELIDVPNPSDSQHPFATMAKFIFADDKPNGNKQGIKVAEFPNIIRSAVGMPMKMNFTGDDVEDHAGSIPIGTIRDMEHVEQDGNNLLVAQAMLWKDEYPEEVQFIKDKYAQGNPPGVSYEISFKDSDQEDGTQWIKGTTALAATFVKHPAYGSRTHLIALASLDEEHRNNQIIALADQIKADTKGGNPVDEELKKANETIARLTGELETANASLKEVTEKVTALEAQAASAEETKKTAIAELETLKKTNLIDNRVRQYVEAGFTMETDAEKAEARKAVFASYDDNQWETYLSDIKAIKPKKESGTDKALAALQNRSDGIPKIETALDDDGLVSLKGRMQGLARPHSI